MLERLTGLPDGIDGLRARGKITKSDFDRIVRPLLDDRRRQGQRMRLIYHLGPEVEAMTAAAAAEDVRLGIGHFHDFERCAVVSDTGWARRAARVAGTIMPCPVKVFANDQWDDAVRWVSSPAEAGHLSHRKMTDEGVVVLEPDGRLSAEDFEALARTVDPWIVQRGGLNGIVVHTRSFPGWENLGAFLRHVRFVRDHRDKVRRLALASDAPIVKFAPGIAQRLLHAEVKRFRYGDLDQAIEWASGAAEARTVKSAATNGKSDKGLEQREER